MSLFISRWPGYVIAGELGHAAFSGVRHRAAQRFVVYFFAGNALDHGRPVMNM